MTPFRTPLPMASTVVGTPKSTIVYRYGNSGAFQETSESWDRPSVPTGPSLGDGRANRPTGGKPDWYRMISDKGNRSPRREGAIPKVHGYLHEVLISTFQSSCCNGITSFDAQDEDEICKVTEDTSSVYKRSATRAVNVQSAFLARDMNYSDYLQLDKVLDAQVDVT
jgi:hypothetical protein